MNETFQPNNIVPTAAPGTANNQAASTAFVANAVTGGTVGSIASFSSLSTAAAATIPGGVLSLITDGYYTQGDGGGGVYIRLTGAPGVVRNWHFTSNGGTVYWQLLESAVKPRQVGAKLDGTLGGSGTDDTVALQAWVDYPVTFGGLSVDQPGIAINPTTVIELQPGARIEGSNLLTILRTTNAESSIMECGTEISAQQAGVTVKGINFQTLAGFAATATAPVTFATVQAGPFPFAINFTAPAGLNLTPGTATTGDYLQLSAAPAPNSNVLNILIGYVSAYNNGTGALTVQIPAALDAVGTGTFTNFNADMYPKQDAAVPFSDAATALRFRHCDRVNVDTVNVTGRFYYGIDVRNGSNVRIRNCEVTGVVNRGIAAQAYGGSSGSTMIDVIIENNFINGNNASLGFPYTTYGINTSSSNVGGNNSVLEMLRIAGNSIESVTGDGIVMGGSINFANCDGNSLIMVSASAANGIIVELVPTANVQQHTVVSNNDITGGNNGIIVLESVFTNVIGNNVFFSQVGILLQGDSTEATIDTVVSGNCVNGCTTNGILLTGSVAGGVANTTITGNIIQSTSGGGDGVKLNGTVANGVSNTNIVANQSLNNGGWGFNGANCLNTIMTGNIAQSNTSGNNNVAGATVPAGSNIGF